MKPSMLIVVLVLGATLFSPNNNASAAPTAAMMRSHDKVTEKDLGNGSKEIRTTNSDGTVLRRVKTTHKSGSYEETKYQSDKQLPQHKEVWNTNTKIRTVTEYTLEGKEHSIRVYGQTTVTITHCRADGSRYVQHWQTDPVTGPRETDEPSPRGRGTLKEVLEYSSTGQLTRQIEMNGEGKIRYVHYFRNGTEKYKVEAGGYLTEKVSSEMLYDYQMSETSWWTIILLALGGIAVCIILSRWPSGME